MQYAARNGQQLMVVLSHSEQGIRRELRAEPRWDARFVRWLRGRPLPLVDLRDAHREVRGQPRGPRFLRHCRSSSALITVWRWRFGATTAPTATPEAAPGMLLAAPAAGWLPLVPRRPVRRICGRGEKYLGASNTSRHHTQPFS